jgi:tetratricopeptide (TPR) repeat protein
MPKFSLIVASMTALLTVAASAPASAQSQNNSGQSIPDAPQPQKKPPAKPPADAGSQPNDKTDSDKTSSQPPASNAPSADKPAPKASSTKDENPFPEDVSKKAAKAADGSSDSDHPADPASGTPKKSTAADNPFPESVSRDAAKAAGNDPAPAAKPDVPPGFSSSQSGPANSPDQADPVRAKKDADVGTFYLQRGDYQGALLRYQDATTADPTNVEAIFGLAETQRMLKKNADAARNYQLYLEIVPNGPKSKQALKALKTLGSGG